MLKDELLILKHAHHDQARTGRRGWFKLVVGICLIALGFLTAWRMGAFDLLTPGNLDSLDAWFESLGWWAPAAFVFLWVVACIFFLPGLALTITGGLIFGAVWGTVWTTVGANLGAIAAFLIGRYAARGVVEGMVERNPLLKRIDDGVRNQGWRMLLITRLVPIFPFNLQNYAYGLTDVSLRTYVLVTLPAMLPATIAFNFAAGSVRTGDFGKTLWYLGIAAVFFVVLSLMPGWVRKRYGGNVPTVDG